MLIIIQFLILKKTQQNLKKNCTATTSSQLSVQIVENNVQVYTIF